MNHWNGIGRLTADPDVRYTQGNKPICIARYTLACDRKYKKEGQPEADFIRILALGKGGEFAEKYFKKGMKVAVGGRIQTGSYEGKNGKVYTTEVVVEDQEFCEAKKATVTAAKPAEQPAEEPGMDGFMSIPDGIDEELPFN